MLQRMVLTVDSFGTAKNRTFFGCYAEEKSIRGAFASLVCTFDPDIIADGEKSDGEESA